VKVEEAHIHCAKHISHLDPYEKLIDWRTDDLYKKGRKFLQRQSRENARNVTSRVGKYQAATILNRELLLQLRKTMC
jgi:hypothetical protein